MYCEHCHKDNPDNFNTCIYCGNSLKPHKKAGFSRVRGKKIKVTPFEAVTFFVIVFLTLSAVSSISLILKTEHPEEAVERFCLAVESNDITLYAGVYDEQYKSFRIDYYYYSEAEYDLALGALLDEQNGFYRETCGEVFTLSSTLTGVSYADEELLLRLNNYLAESCYYKEAVEKCAFIDASISASGTKGTYLTVYKHKPIIKLDGEWYYIIEPPDWLM